MGNKVVCLDCRKAFSERTDLVNRTHSSCPNCGKKMISLPHRFRPPKITDLKKWETVKYFIENGFYYQHIYKGAETSEHYNRQQSYVEYPEYIRDAKEFVEKYKSQARKTNVAQ